MIVEVNESQFRQHMEEKNRFAAFFHTPFCANCSFARNVLNTVTKRLPIDVPIVSSNLNVMPTLAEPLQVMTVPLLLFIKDGEPVEQFVAFGRADELFFSLIHFFGQNEKD